MATINDALIMRMYGLAVGHLRKYTSLLKYVRREDPNSSVTPSAQGQTINIPVPGDMTDAEDVTASSTPIAGTQVTPGYATLTLDKWKRKGFPMTDAELTYIAAGVVDGQMEVCIDKIGKAILTDIWGKYTGIANYTGTAGTTPFASSTVDAQNADLRLNLSGAPMSNRAIVLGHYAMANAKGLNIFQRVNEGGMDRLTEGQIGRALGFDWDADSYVPTHTAGTLVNGSSAKVALVNNGAGYAAGTSTIAVDHTTLTGTVVVGDVFKFSGHDTCYVVTANATASGNAIASLAFAPALTNAVVDNESLTFAASHVVNLAFQRDALAFASRPLDNVMFKGGSEIIAIPDPLTGVTLRMEISRQHKQTMIDFDVLFGSVLVNRDRACRILG